MKRLLPVLFVSAAVAAQAPIAEQYRGTASRLIAAAQTDNAGLERLEYLCDSIGNRLSGSKSLEKAIVWAQAEMKKAGLENVQTIRVKVPHWVRGHESAVFLTPVERPMMMLGLGDSVGTPPEGITAEVISVSSFPELTALGRAKVAGKIVLYDVPFTNYGQTVAYRSGGPSAAAQLGAVATLVRSVTPLSLRSPHTGALRYDESAPKIPAAAITVEDAGSITRLTKSGQTVRVKLTMEARMEADADSFDVMGEIRGREKPDEVVVLGGHIDSWDVGQGAQDDGSGIMAALQAVSLIHKLDLHPRRTIRVVFWTNEENGGAGGIAYRKWLGDKIKSHVAAIEMDGGAEKPVGFGYGTASGGGRRRRGAAGVTEAVTPNAAPDAAFLRASEIGKLLTPIEAGTINHGGGGSDIAPLVADGVPGFGMETVGVHYFDWHHTHADTFDKIDPREFKLCTAALAVLSYVLADMPERLSEIK